MCSGDRGIGRRGAAGRTADIAIADRVGGDSWRHCVGGGVGCIERENYLRTIRNSGVAAT